MPLKNNMTPKFFLTTMGCQMNKNDSERIAGLLQSIGIKQTGNAPEADLLLVNTCSVRQSAEDRVFGLVTNWREFKEKNPKTIIAITGCMPGRDKDGCLKRRFLGVDLWFGIEELPRLPAWLIELGVLDRAETIAGEITDYLSVIPARENRSRAFIAVQTGCNNFCSYCVVPYARGRERNRPVCDIVSEARNFVSGGGLEVALLGQVVNHYIAPDPSNFSSNNPFIGEDDFAALLWEINQLDGLKRIFFTAPDPQYFSEAQIEALSLPRQINYLHLPAQSGNNEILRKMNRKYTREGYLDLIKKIRAARPAIALGTDLIVGFCGETAEQFQDTLDFYKECDFDIAYTAMYSSRSGTVAAKIMKDNVARAEKKNRWDKLQMLMEAQTLRKNQAYVGRKVEALVDSCDNGVCSGMSGEMKLVQFLGAPDLIGKIISAKIFEAKEWLLKGELI